MGSWDCCSKEEEAQLSQKCRFHRRGLFLSPRPQGLFARRRQLLLTEGPHLYYVDPVNKVLKGEIPWSQELRPEAKNFKTFFVHTVSVPVSTGPTYRQFGDDFWGVRGALSALFFWPRSPTGHTT